MAAGTESDDSGGVLNGLRVDLVRFHESWMELIFPRQRGAAHSVLGKWKPTTTADRVKYRVWGAIGALVVMVTYPLVLIGVVVRFYSRRIDSTATRIGLVGVIVLSVLLWGGLTVLARYRFSLEGFYAVAAASMVAVVSSVLALVFTRVGGRGTTIALAYPFGMTAIFLPPVVAALYSPTVAEAVVLPSERLADYALNNFAPPRVEQFLRSKYELEGLALVGMWFGIAVPLGWLFGILVSLADVVRPTDEDE